MSGVTTTVWPVIEVTDDGATLALVAASRGAAMRHASIYVGGARLEWEHRNSMFDSQDYLVAYHDGAEYHTYEEDLEE